MRGVSRLDTPQYRLIPEQTIAKARAENRIATDARMEEQLATFRRRMAWAETRWKLEIKPNN